MQSGDYPNLHLLVDSKVTRVLFDGNKRATGIEYTPSATSQPVTGVNGSPTFKVTAKKMVVVSSGALGTPSVLERSGVGNKDILSKLDIPVVSDLPDVGENYQDHHLVLYPYKTSLKPEKTIDGFLAGRKDFGESIQNNDPMLGWNAIDISSKIRPTDKEIEAMGPQFKEHWDKDFKDRPTRPVMLTGVVQSFLGDHKLLPQREDGVPEQYCTVGVSEPRIQPNLLMSKTLILLLLNAGLYCVPVLPRRHPHHIEGRQNTSFIQHRFLQSRRRCQKANLGVQEAA
jgi:alcohol oxidase